MYLERFENVEYCRANVVDIEYKMLENSGYRGNRKNIMERSGMNAQYVSV